MKGAEGERRRKEGRTRKEEREEQTRRGFDELVKRVRGRQRRRGRGRR